MMIKTGFLFLLIILLVSTSSRGLANGCDDLAVKIHNQTNDTLQIEFRRGYFNDLSGENFETEKSSLSIAPDQTMILDKTINTNSYRYIYNDITIPIQAGFSLRHMIKKYYTTGNTPGEIFYNYQIVYPCKHGHCSESRSPPTFQYFFKAREDHNISYVHSISPAICGGENRAKPDEIALEIISAYQ